MAGTTEEAYTSIEEYFDAIDERLEQVCDTVLKPRIEALEAERQKVRGYITRAIVVAAIPAVLFYNSLTQRVKEFASEMDDFAMEFLNIAERNFT